MENPELIVNSEISDRQKEVHRQKFFENLNKEYNKENSTSKIINQERSQLIMRIINKTEPKPDPNFKHYIKKNQYNIIINDGKDTLHKVCVNKNHTNNLPVAIKEDFFEILYSIHSIQRGHIGILKTEYELKLRYYGSLLRLQLIWN